MTIENEFVLTPEEIAYLYGGDMKAIVPASAMRLARNVERTGSERRSRIPPTPTEAAPTIRDSLMVGGEAGTVPLAWIRKTDITEWADTEPETDGWTPLYAAPPSAPTAEPVRDDDLVLVPRVLIGAACGAIRLKRDAPKTLSELRRYTVGDLSDTALPAESAEPVNITADDVHWFEGAFRAWECNDFAGVLDGLASAVNHFMPSGVPTAATADVPRAYMGGREGGKSRLSEALAAATADAQVIAIGLDGLLCEHCGDGHTELTFEDGQFSCNCDTCSADCQYFAVERLNALIKPKDAQGDERASLRGAANLAFNALHECKPNKGAEKQVSDAIQALTEALHDIAYTVNRTATPQQFADHLQREARAALSRQPSAPDMRDAYVGAREDLEDWKRRALAAEDLNRKFAASVNGPTFMGEPSAPASAFRECHSKIIKAIASIARADGPDQRRESDPELIYRSPVMDEVCRIRDALDTCSAALAAAKPTMTLKEFCAEADHLGLTAETLAKQLAVRPEFSDCVAAAKPEGGE